MWSHPERGTAPWRKARQVMGWAEGFDMNRLQEQVNAMAEAIASLEIKVMDLKAQVESQEFIGTPPPGAFRPRNQRYFGA